MDSLGFYLSRTFVKFSIRRVYSQHGWGKCSDYWKMHLRVKKLILVIFTHASKAKISPRFLSSPIRQREITLRELKNRPKLNLWGDWSQVLINPIIFAAFTFSLTVFRSSHRRYSLKKGVLRNFTKFTGKQ